MRQKEQCSTLLFASWTSQAKQTNKTLQTGSFLSCTGRSFSIVTEICGEKVDLAREQQRHTKGIPRITGPYWAQGKSKYCRRRANATGQKNGVGLTLNKIS